MGTLALTMVFCAAIAVRGIRRQAAFVVALGLASCSGKNQIGVQLDGGAGTSGHGGAGGSLGGGAGGGVAPSPFEAQTLAIAAEYLAWGRVDDELRWAPFLCRQPLPWRQPRPR